jgi:hypothetical protein
VRRLFKSRWFYTAHNVLGWGLLAGYLALTNDWRISPLQSLGFPAIAFLTGWLFQLKPFRRFPALNRYLLYEESDPRRPRPISNDDWARKQADYLRSLFGLRAVLSTPAEDGLICVPVVLSGIEPLSAILGGLVFGFLHLGRFTYLECIAKAIWYALVCLLILPSGVLTVVLGHVITNASGFVILQLGRRAPSKNLRSNSSVNAAGNARNPEQQ